MTNPASQLHVILDIASVECCLGSRYEKPSAFLTFLTFQLVLQMPALAEILLNVSAGMMGGSGDVASAHVNVTDALQKT